MKFCKVEKKVVKKQKDQSEQQLKDKANLIDMSLTLSWIALTLFTKALLWDDDDKEDDTIQRTT